VALVFLMGGLAGIAAGYFGGWTDRIVGRIADTIMAFPLFVLAMGIVAALGNTVQNIIIATAIVNFPLYARVARAEPMCAASRLRAGGAAVGQRRDSHLLVHILPNIMPIMIVQMSLTMGYAILNAPDFPSSASACGRRRRSGASWSRKARLHGVRRMVDRAVPGPRADARGVLLQLARRRPARHRRSAAEDVMADSGFARRGLAWVEEMRRCAGRFYFAWGCFRDFCGAHHDGPAPARRQRPHRSNSPRAAAS
jgi:hypothetical protein